jgi:hypothetical protein
MDTPHRRARRHGSWEPAGVQPAPGGTAVMTAVACAHAERQVPAAELTTAFGEDPQRLRLIAAVYIAGQVVVATTVGLAVTRAGVCDCAAADCGDRGVEVDFTGFGGRPVPLPDVLAGAAAGYQATFIWLQSGGIEAADWPYDVALGFLAACDISTCLHTCRRLGRPDLSMQDAIEGAWCILICRWDTVLQLAYRLASRGVLAGADLQSCLAEDPAQRAAAASAYQAWRRRTRHRWQRCAATPSGRVHSAGRLD